MQRSIVRAARGVLVGLAASAMLVTGIATAHDATPTASAEGMPAHIHAGSCDALGEHVYPLDNLMNVTESDATPIAQPAMEHAEGVFTSVTVVDVSLDDLLAGEYAINVHLSADAMDTYVACGDIVGVPRFHMRSDAPYGLVIPMRELNDSGYAGVAWLEPTGDNETTVTVFLASGLIGTGPNAGGR